MEPTKIRLYRITHLENLSLLCREKGLWCGRESVERGSPYLSIGNVDLTRSRSGVLVPCSEKGCLGDYVPFYFSPRPVMLYNIFRRTANTYGGGQEAIVHLITNVAAIQRAQIPFAYTDRHAYVKTRRFYDTPSSFDRLDWDAIRSRDWQNTTAAPDRKERKQAEFLAYRFVPLVCFQGVGVFSQSQKQDVEEIFREFGITLPVQVKQDWYY